MGAAKIMTTDLDISGTANELIKQHGDKASVFAAMRADELIEAEDRGGWTTWFRIVVAIEELMRQTPLEGDAVY